MRIHTCAQQLAEQHGLDGFSMDDLAEAADVSRRTLFNYFAGKDDAVLGDPLELDPELTDRFVAGGPTGHLVDDMVALIETTFDAGEINRDEVARARRLLATEPRLMAAAHQRFAAIGAEVVELIAAREGDRHDPAQARVVVHVLAVLFDLALTAFIADPHGDLRGLFDDAIRRARTAFA
ncbi:TetR/AcrR family transcriptional regulator [Angustibacter sp. McL0619]|uniref:TetR/AcrR family transcriptional regulator n=1 Tax=Angustibacter sp. McL0619 TaxID=3415676 RepID=UPI003CE979FD